MADPFVIPNGGIPVTVPDIQQQAAMQQAMVQQTQHQDMAIRMDCLRIAAELGGASLRAGISVSSDEVTEAAEIFADYVKNGR